MQVKLIMARTRSTSNTSSKAVPVSSAKCTREERRVSSSKAVPVSPAKSTQEEHRVLYQEAREEVKFLLDNLDDMGDSDDNNVGGSLL